MLTIALTGGIGSGKSTAADDFVQLGVPVIDADQLTRELVMPGSPALQEIAAAFGPEILLPDGTLDRAQLRSKVFTDPTQRRRLEAILHPRVYAEMRRRVQSLQAPYCILVIPLLLETGETSIADRILVVDSPEALQKSRARKRDNMSDEELEAVLAAQVSRTQRLQAADDLLVNDGDRDHLHRQVSALHQRYLTLASSPGYKE